MIVQRGEARKQKHGTCNMYTQIWKKTNEKEETEHNKKKKTYTKQALKTCDMKAWATMSVCVC